MTAWHSILYCYEVRPRQAVAGGGEPVLGECARAAELTTADVSEVPAATTRCASFASPPGATPRGIRAAQDMIPSSCR